MTRIGVGIIGAGVIAAIAAQKRQEKVKEPTPEERRAAETAAFKAETKSQLTLLAVATGLLLIVGAFAPAACRAT